MKISSFSLPALLLCMGAFSYFAPASPSWESKFIKSAKSGVLQYTPDADGNIIPDFSRVGYYFGDRDLPAVPVVKSISPTGTDNEQDHIQAAIDEVAKRTPDKHGFRGALLLKKGRYPIADRIRINTSGIILRGEPGTVLIATAKTQVSLIDVSGDGQLKEVPGTCAKITDAYVPAGTFTVTVDNAARFRPGDAVILFRPGTQAWITDLKMDQIDTRPGTRQWQPKEYDLRYERSIVKIDGNKVTLDNPVVMPMETKYGGGELYRYTFEGRIRHIGIEDLTCESTYDADTAENHAWDAVAFGKAEHSWVKGVTARYFGYSCVNLKRDARNITVTGSHCFEHKSLITGSRRYSFNNAGQLNLFTDCHATDGRHDYVTGAVTCGPNVFVNCTAKRTHADIGPHHRWASGTLYDNIVTDGEINIQDRGNWGSGHGWAGVTQVVWNCTVKQAAVQSPWVSGHNYCIGLQGEKVTGRLKGRPDAEWEGQNKPGLLPASLYFAQLKARKAAGIKK